MTRIISLTALVAVLASAAVAQPPPVLEKPFAILTRTSPHFEAKRFIHPPADSAWQFRADSSSVGTLEVGFQADQVVYMVFRRGVGGVSWKQHDIDALHDIYCKELLHEPRCGNFYASFLASQINAAIIARRDFDPKPLLSGL